MNIIKCPHCGDELVQDNNIGLDGTILAGIPKNFVVSSENIKAFKCWSCFHSLAGYFLFFYFLMEKKWFEFDGADQKWKPIKSKGVFVFR